MRKDEEAPSRGHPVGLALALEVIAEAHQAGIRRVCGLAVFEQAHPLLADASTSGYGALADLPLLQKSDGFFKEVFGHERSIALLSE